MVIMVFLETKVMIMKIKKVAFLTVIPFVLSCSISDMTPKTNLLKATQKAKNSITRGVKIPLKIATSAFKLKAEGTIPTLKTSADVKSFKIFITDTPTDPFSSNVLGYIDDFDKGIESTSTYFFLPVGGPYYAVAAAYDNTIDSDENNNITAENPTIVSTFPEEKNWSVSTNSVTIKEDLTVVFSNEGTQLSINIKLKGVTPPMLETNIEHVEGSSTINDFSAI